TRRSSDLRTNSIRTKSVRTNRAGNPARRPKRAARDRDSALAVPGASPFIPRAELSSHHLDGVEMAAVDPGTRMAISTGKVDITRAAGYFMGGYGMDEPRTASGEAKQPLYARCLALWENGLPSVIVTAEVLAIPPPMHHALRDRVTALTVNGTRVASEHFVVTATHTHNGPVLVDELNPFMAYNLS